MKNREYRLSTGWREDIREREGRNGRIYTSQSPVQVWSCTLIENGKEIGGEEFSTKRDAVSFGNKWTNQENSMNFTHDECEEVIMSNTQEKQQPFYHTTDFEFIDISSEEWREYDWDYRIENPLWLAVSPSGSHRILDADGFSHYINPRESFAIKWKAKDGSPKFVK